MPEDSNRSAMADDIQALEVYRNIKEYCQRYNIPVENLLDILEDQKVLPMIRGKATEYIGAAYLRQILSSREWDVQKLNLNPQQSSRDEDISITFRRTGRRLGAETKNAVRGKFRMNSRKFDVPHFNVKCHRSRSNLKLSNTTNDRYNYSDFDLLLCNPSNSIFKGKSLDAGLHLIEDPEALRWLMNFYQVGTEQELVRAAYDDWRFCLPYSIADENGTIPRTPAVLMENDPNWFGPNELPERLRSLIEG